MAAKSVDMRLRRRCEVRCPRENHPCRPVLFCYTASVFVFEPAEVLKLPELVHLCELPF